MTTRFRALLAALLATVLVASSFVGPAAGDVTNNVTDDDDDFDGATVTLYNATDDSQVAQNTTSSGSMTFASESDGDYYAEVTYDGYAASSAATFTVAGAAVSKSLLMTENTSEAANGTVAIESDTTSVATPSPGLSISRATATV